MRNAFAKTVTDLAARDPRVVLLAGDIGNRLFDGFKDCAPGRFYNCGVAEANMTTMAAGLALCGLRPFTYTITPFTTARVFEQIRVDVCYHKLPVVIVGTGSGLSYASLGPTHHSLEDIALLRTLPGMTILCPADVHEVREAVHAVMNLSGPCYIRLGKKGEPEVHSGPPRFVVGEWIPLRDGHDVTLLAAGNLVKTALLTADDLQAQGLSVAVYSAHTVKPLDQACLRSAFTNSAVVGVLEEHGRIGGFGGAVAEWLAEQGSRFNGRLVLFGTPDRFFSTSGSQEHLRTLSELDPPAVAKRLLAVLAEERSAAHRATRH